MARHEGRIQDAGGQPLGLDELLALLDPERGVDAEARCDAIACYLAGGDGWREAVKRIGGAFADGCNGMNRK